ncbi:MAG: hypothetical protein R3B39_01915 [Candidatus Paceibacterota bacterium]
MRFVKDYFVASTGQVLNTLVPSLLFTNYQEINKKSVNDHVRGPLAREKYSFQAPTEDRLVIFKTYIRESFAKKESVYLCFPNISDAKYFYESLQKGIRRIFFFNPRRLFKKRIYRKI